MSCLGHDGRVRVGALFVSLVALTSASAQTSDELRVGHWATVKGELRGEAEFVASEVEVGEPEEEEILLGVATDVTEDGTEFRVLGQRITVSERTDWRSVSAAALGGTRVKVEGHYRGLRKFSARTVAARGPGRERVGGRIDEIRAVDGGVELAIMRYRVFVPDGASIGSEKALAELSLAPALVQLTDVRERDDDDYVPAAIRITDELYLGARLELKARSEDEYDLDEGDDEDRRDDELSVRAELTWLPADDFYGFLGVRHSRLWRDDEDSTGDDREDTRVSEAYGYWRDVWFDGLDVQVGRQDFDEDREWIYDQNLDALRLVYSRPRWRLEMSASTTYSDGSPRDENTDNLIAYLSNNDEDRTLAAYVVDRRDDRGPDDYPIHFGVRALGEWLPDNDVWAEYSVLRGYVDDVDLESYGFDVGTTWSPDFAEPFYFSAGYAFGSGDDDPFDDVDEGYRQTGLHDNNGKFGGVTSFRYYGELVDPELSNLEVFTAGVGLRFANKSSLDLVYHRFEQVEAADFLLDSDLDRRPNGIDRDLGWEVDLVFGSRAWEHADLEVVVGMFEPGDAFPDGDTAYLGAIQLRFRL